MYILLYYENSDSEILVTYSLYANKINNKHTVLGTVYTVLCAGVHCPTNNQNFCIKSEPVMAGADGTVNVQLLFRYKNIKCCETVSYLREMIPLYSIAMALTVKLATCRALSIRSSFVFVYHKTSPFYTNCTVPMIYCLSAYSSSTFRTIASGTLVVYPWSLLSFCPILYCNLKVDFEYYSVGFFSARLPG